MEGKPERFALVDGTDVPMAFWCGTKRGPITLPEGPFYRLDYMEVHPRLRGGPLSVFMVALWACRALELGANGIVLSAFPAEGLLAFYRRAGAVERQPRGWNQPRGLVPFVFERPLLEELKGYADGLLEDEET
jgi:hypothetical protein